MTVALRIGILSDGTVSAVAGEQLAVLTKMIVGAGGMVVVPENSGLLSTPVYRENDANTPACIMANRSWCVKYR